MICLAHRETDRSNYTDAANVFGHGLVGGTSSWLSGGDFRSGFIGASFGALASPVVKLIPGDGGGYVMARVLVAGMIGGTSSHLAGGDFGSGFATAAFGRLFNDEHHYTAGPNQVCTAAQACTSQYMADQMSRFGVPGQDPSVPLVSGNIYDVYDPRTGMYAGKVLTGISADGLTITNTTQPGHIFYDGRIVRSAILNVDGSWSVTTHGYGNNIYPGAATINQWQGPKIFNYMDEQMRMNIEAHH